MMNLNIENNNNNSQISCNKMIKFNYLNITAINVNSIQSSVRRFNLKDTIDKIKPDTVLLSETKLSTRHRLAFKNYAMIRNDRTGNKGEGGTAIILKDNIKFQNVNLKSVNSMKTIATTINKIQIQNSHNLFIISAYVPGYKKSNFSNDLSLIFEELH